MNIRQLNAYWTLGTALTKHVLVVPFAKGRSVWTWLGRLRQENLARTAKDAWSRQEAAGRCIGCGLCDVLAPTQGPLSEWILSAGREPGDAPLGRAKAEILLQHADAIARICPASVDVRGLAELIIANAKELDAP